MPILALLTGVFSSIADLFKTHIQEPQAQMTALAALQEQQNKALAIAADLEKEKLELQKVALTSNNKLVADYMPIIAICMTLLIVAMSFHLVPMPPDNSPIWQLMEWVFGTSIGAHGGMHVASIVKTGERMK